MCGRVGNLYRFANLSACLAVGIYCVTCTLLCVFKFEINDIVIKPRYYIDKLMLAGF